MTGLPADEIAAYLDRTGKLAVEQGKALNWLFELRSVGDYGGPVHVSPQEAKQAIEAAEKFVDAVKTLLQIP